MRTLFSVVAALMLWVSSGTQALAYNECENPAEGCVAPINYKWRGAYNKLFSSRMAAAQSVADYLKTQNPACDRGLLTAPVEVPQNGICYGGGWCGNYTKFNSDPRNVSGQGVFSWGNYGMGNNVQVCHNHSSYFSQPSCPKGYELTYNQGVSTNNEIWWACRPTRSSSAIAGTGPSLFGGSDGNQEGCTFGCNPVNLGNAHKVSKDTDYTNQSALPIEWNRYYESGARGWRFEYDRRVVLFRGQPDSGPAIAKATVTRPNGAILEFATTDATFGSAWTWTTHSTVQSKLKEIQSQGAITGFELINADGTTEIYNQNGFLTSMNSPSGDTLQFTYDSSDRLTQVLDTAGRVLSVEYPSTSTPLTFTWNTPNPDPNLPQTETVTEDSWELPGHTAIERLPARIKANGVTIAEYEWVMTAEYESPIVLKSVRLSGGPPKTYIYGESGFGRNAYPTTMTGIVDENSNRYSTYTADKAEIFSVEHGTANDIIYYNLGQVDPPIGATIYFNTHNANYSVDYVNTIGKLSGQSAPCATCGGTQVKNMDYDAYGNPTYIKDFDDRVETRTYLGTRGLMASRTEASGTALARTTSYTWHSTLPLPLTIVEPLDTGSRTTTLAYDTSNRPTSVTVSAPGGSDRVKTFTYNSQGDLASVTHPNGREDRYGYDTARNLTSVVAAYGTSLARTSTLGGYDYHGNAGWMEGPDGVRATFTRDARQRVTQVVRTGGTLSLTAQVEYNPIGKMSAMVAANGLRTEFVYDDAHRLVEVRQKSATGSLLGKVVYTLNGVNKPTKQEVYGPSAKEMEAQFGYDNYNRLTQEIGAASQTSSSTLSLQGNVTAMSDPMQHGATRQYDALGRLSQMTDGDGTYALGYDTDDNTLSATDARGVATGYTYNGFGDLTQIQSPDRGTWSFTYGADGERVTTTDPRGVVETRSVDLLGRTTQKAFSGAGVSGTPAGFVAGSKTQAFAYDSCTNGTGKLCSVTDDSGVTGFSYDTLGRLAGRSWTGKSTGPAAGATLAIGYGYNSLGQLSSMVYPSGKTLAMTYGTDGQLESLTYDGQSVAGGIDWNALGQLKDFTFGMPNLPTGASTVAFTYDLDGQIEEVADSDVRSYVRNADGQITGIDDADPAKAQLFAYSPTHRLTQQDVGAWSSPLDFTYDATGNRTSKGDGVSTVNYTYGLTSNRLVAQGSFTPAYDAMGSLIDDGQGRTLSYDVQGRLTTASYGGSGANYTYDALGQRKTKSVTGIGAGQTIFMHDQAGRLLGAYTPDGNGGFAVDEELVWIDGWRPIATVRPDATLGMTSPVLYPILTDHLGSPRKVLDPTTGAAIWSWDTKEAFGQQMPSEDPDADSVNFKLNLRLAGQWFDGETGLFHNNFRDYHPSLGRYVQSDPLGLEAGWNTYAFVDGDAVNQFDPLGLDVFQDAVDYWQMPAIPQSIVDFSAGMGDMVSGGLTQHIRREWGTDCMVGASGYYTAGMVAGVLPAMFGTGAAFGRTVNMGVRFGAQRGWFALRHYTSSSAAASIEANGFIANEGLYGKAIYVTPLGPRAAKILGAANTESSVIVSSSSRIVTTPVPGNLMVIP